MKTSYDDLHPIELAPGVFHLGAQDKQNTWANIPYLVVEGDEAALIDPGSAKGDFYQVVLQKVHKAIDPRKIKYLIVQHQDPDLCAALPLFEKIVDPNVQILAPLEAMLLVQHYGCTHTIRPVDDGETITLGRNRTLTFAMTPYAHFIGSMVTYDAKTKTVFSSDAFGGFTLGDNLFANDDYPQHLTTFLGQYLGSKRALEYALARLQQLIDGPGLDRICPQHGCVIKKEQIPVYMKAAHALEVGGEVTRLARKHGINLQWEEVRKGGAR
jgi:flavorubredoxin